jgi:hypothetical protein
MLVWIGSINGLFKQFYQGDNLVVSILLYLLQLQ